MLSLNHILKCLIDRDPATLEACITATAEAEAIFTLSASGMVRSLPEALHHALEDSFEQIRAVAPVDAAVARHPLGSGIEADSF